jgi:hypothetical protein
MNSLFFKKSPLGLLSIKERRSGGEFAGIPLFLHRLYNSLFFSKEFYIRLDIFL